MTEPRRLLSDDETSDLARRLLTAGRTRREAEGARERVWTAIGAAATAGAATGLGAGAATRGVIIGATKLKVLAIAGAVAAAVSAGALVATTRERVSEAPRDAPAASAGGEAIALAAAEPPRAEPVTPARPSGVATVAAAAARPPPKARPPRSAGAPRAEAARGSAAHGATGGEPGHVGTSELREEAALLREVHGALARGDVGVARARLEEARRRFPTSQLEQERAALDVRLAVASGDSKRAAILARAFFERYPDSPLRAGIEPIGRGIENP